FAAESWNNYGIKTDLRARAASLLAFRGTVSSTVAVAGHEIEVVATANTSEICRRIEFGLGAIDDRDVVRSLSPLPCDAPVSDCWLSEWDRAVLDTAPPGTVSVECDHIVRHCAPPVTITGIVFEHRDRRVDPRVPFPSVAPRGVVTRDVPDSLVDD